MDKSIKKKRFIIRWTIILLMIFVLFFWAIWNAVLDDFFTWKRTLFFNYNSFNKAADGCYAEKLPNSAYDIEYYLGNRRFVRVSGCGYSLEEDEYEYAKTDAISRYYKLVADGKILDTTTYYSYDDDGTKKYLSEEIVEEYDIGEIKKLLGKNEELSQYYILVLHNTSDAPIIYFDGAFCNDKTGRIIEVSKTDRRGAVF
ncbi:MAG: hypothetical protein IKJ15_07610 [Lachnospiraceae bacterium]|nr:hypothetical protein [Lachnospiraceae bacterium]